MRSISIASAGIPSTPVIGTATAGDAFATVAFTPSTYIGKGTVNYELTSSPGGLNGNGTTSPISIGLVNGITYTFTVRAITNYGVSSAYSSSSNAVTPVAPPVPPPEPPGPPPCTCGWNGANCSGNGSNCGCSYVSYSCVGDLSYEYYDCGCSQGAQCSGTGGYNGAYRDGVCGYVQVTTQVCRCSAGYCVDNGCGGQICYDSCNQYCSGSACPAACPDCGNIGPCCPPAGCGSIKGGYICI